MKKKKIVIILSTVILITLVFTVTFCLNSKSTKVTTVSNKVYVGDLNVSKQSKEDLKNNLNTYFSKKLKETSIKFEAGDYKESFSLDKIGFKYNVDELVDKALNVGHDGNIFTNGIEQLNSLFSSKVLEAKPILDKDVFDAFKATISKKVSKPITSPNVAFLNNKLSISGGKSGVTLDENGFTENINKLNLDRNNLGNLSCTIPTKEVPVNISPDIVNKMTIIGSYSTTINHIDAGRTNNIRLFLSKLSGHVLMPNETFSCDKTAGSREIADGYTSAAGFSNNQVVDTVAGGICQGVSTLYNAVLYADLKIVERAPHCMAVTYIEEGRDATIASGNIDFKFKNNKNTPVVIQCYVNQGTTVVANIWGVNDTPNKKIEISVEKLGPNKTKTYKKTLISGKVTKTEVLSVDTYK